MSAGNTFGLRVGRAARLHAIVPALMLVGAGAPAATAEASDPAITSSANPGDEVRLGTIGYRLATANGDRCVRPEMMTGLLLHDLGSYDAAARPKISQVYGLGRGFGVLQLIPGSRAEQAGLRRGDEIVAVNDIDLAAFAPQLIGRGASPDRTERFTDLLDGALQNGPAKLAVRRGAGTVTLSLEGVKGCGGRFVAVPGNELNAWSDGRYVAVTARMMRYAADDQELAFIVAHEMAHNILGHAAPPREGAPVSARTARGKAAEIAADAMAIELLARAGFDLAAPSRFLRRTAHLQWLALHLSHPGNSARIRIVNASIAKLEHAGGSPSSPAAAGGCTIAPPRDGGSAAGAQPPACPQEDDADVVAQTMSTSEDPARSPSPSIGLRPALRMRGAS